MSLPIKKLILFLTLSCYMTTKIWKLLQVKTEFMQMLREVVTADRPMTWDNVHAMIEFDPRCRAIASSAQREDWFREFCATVHPVQTQSVSVTPIKHVPEIGISHCKSTPEIWLWFLACLSCKSGTGVPVSGVDQKYCFISSQKLACIWQWCDLWLVASSPELWLRFCANLPCKSDITLKYRFLLLIRNMLYSRPETGITEMMICYWLLVIVYFFISC